MCSAFGLPIVTLQTIFIDMSYDRCYIWEFCSVLINIVPYNTALHEICLSVRSFLCPNTLSGFEELHLADSYILDP